MNEYPLPHLSEDVHNDPDGLAHFDFLQYVELLIVVGEGPGGAVTQQVLPRLLQN